MRIELDLTTVPPTATLREPDDFERFEVLATQTGHVFVTVDELRRLAGERAEDAEWLRRLDDMVGYAESKGWIGEDGSIRAHLEWRE